MCHDLFNDINCFNIVFYPHFVYILIKQLNFTKPPNQYPNIFSQQLPLQFNVCVSSSLVTCLFIHRCSVHNSQPLGEVF